MSKKRLQTPFRAVMTLYVIGTVVLAVPRFGTHILLELHSRVVYGLAFPPPEMYITTMDINRNSVYRSDQQAVRLTAIGNRKVVLSSACGSVTGRYSWWNAYKFNLRNGELEDSCRGLWHKATALNAVNQFRWLRGPRLHMSTTDGQYTMNWWPVDPDAK